MHFWLLCNSHNGDVKSFAVHTKLWDLYTHLSCVGHIPCLAWNYGNRMMYRFGFVCMISKDGIVMVLNQKYAMRALSCLLRGASIPSFSLPAPALHIYVGLLMLTPGKCTAQMRKNQHKRGYCWTEWLYLCCVEEFCAPWQSVNIWWPTGRLQELLKRLKL